MIYLMLVENNDLVREVLAKLFKQEQDITVVASVSDGSTAIKQLMIHPVIDVVIADWNMPEMSGLELTNHITLYFPKVKTIILTIHGKQDYKDQAKAAGARGFILKEGDFVELLAGVRDVAEGVTVFK